MFTRSIAVFLVMSADEGILRCKDIFLALSTHLPVSLTSHSLHPILAMAGINSRLFDDRSWLILCSACPAVFIHSFRFVYQFHFTLYHSFSVVHSFSHTFIHFCMPFIDWLIVAPVGAVRSRTWSTGQPAVERSHAVPAFIACVACHYWLINWLCLIHFSRFNHSHAIHHDSFVHFPLIESFDINQFNLSSFISFNHSYSLLHECLDWLIGWLI